MSLPTVFYLSDSSMSSLSLTNHGRKKRGGNKTKNQIPTGDILIDSSKKEWIIHTSIARGGFGEIYTASGPKCSNQQDYVIKIEPSENGPLFCEKTVYIRIGKKEDIKEYMKLKGLKSLGMPQFYGCGIHNSDGKKFRFLVMERYGKDLWSIFLEQNRIFPPAAVYKVANQVLDVLEYIHSKGYVHADIKGANLLLGRAKGLENQVYLVDFGLAARYTNVFKPDPRRAHNGTLEYTSRDGHEGIVTRRGDIEVLGYNILQWISSNLPWELTKDINEVQSLKIKYMKDCNLLLKSCFQKNSPPSPLEKYFNTLSNMGPLEEPKYYVFHQHMKEGLSKLGDTNSKLEFEQSKVKSATKEKSKTTVKSRLPSPVPNKLRKLAANNPKAKANAAKSPQMRKKKVNSTIDLSEGTSEGDSNENEMDYERDMFIESSPDERKKRTQKQKESATVKRSWKDCPSVVSCAELLLKDDRIIRRSKRNK